MNLYDIRRARIDDAICPEGYNARFSGAIIRDADRFGDRDPPYPPGLSALISHLAAVFEIEPRKALRRAVQLED